MSAAMTETQAPRARRRPRVEAAALAALVAAAAWNQVDHFAQISTIREFNDSATYMRVADLGVSSPQRWFGSTPPLTSLWFKLLGRDPATIAGAHLAASLGAWSALAIVAARTLRTWWLRPAACALVLAFSMTVAVTQWHKVMLSESLSFSLLAALAAAWLVQLERGDRASGTLVVVLGVLYALVRDTNAYLLVLLGALLALSASMRWPALSALSASTQWPAPSASTPEPSRSTSIGRLATVRAHRPPHTAVRAALPPSRRARLAVAAAYAATFAFVWTSANAGERWVPALYNNVSQRILPYPERTRELQEAGMPMDAALAERRGKWAWDDDSAYFRDPRLERFRRWAREHGKGAYARFLAARPLYVVVEPLRAFPTLAFPQLGWMSPKGYSPPLRGVPGVALFTSPRMLPMYLIACVVLLAAGVARRALRSHPAYRAGVVLIALAVPGVALAWHASPMEVQRHALHCIVPARLGLLLAAIATADETARFVARAARRRGAAASSARATH
jgi:hypothetical protein